jgi:hypothetical protein
MSGFDLARANELAAENPKVDSALLNRLDAALTALEQVGITGTPSYGITSPYEWRRLEAIQRDRQELQD